MTRSFAKTDCNFDRELNEFVEEINSINSEVEAKKNSRIEWLNRIRRWLRNIEFSLWDDDTNLGHNEGVYNPEWYSATAFVMVLNELRETREFSTEGLWLV